MFVSTLLLVLCSGQVTQVGPAEGADLWDFQVAEVAGGLVHVQDLAGKRHLVLRSSDLFGAPAAKRALGKDPAPILRYSRNAATLAVLASERVSLADGKTLAPKGKLSLRCSPCSFDLDPSGSRLVHVVPGAAGAGTVFALYDVATGKRVRETKSARSFAVGQVRLLDDRQLLLAPFEGATLSVIDLETGAERSLPTPQPPACAPKQPAEPTLTSFSVHPSEPLVAATWIAPYVRCTSAPPNTRYAWLTVYRLPGLEAVAVPDALQFEAKLSALSWVDGGRLLAVGDKLGFVHVLDAVSFARLEKIPAHARQGGDFQVDRLVWDPLSRLLVSASFARTKAWDLSLLLGGASDAGVSVSKSPAGCHIGNCVDGEGRLKSEAGDVFEGTFVAGKLHGAGNRYSTAAGEVYEGQLVNGVRHGSGSLTIPGKGTYVGTWKQGLREGEGTLTVPGLFTLTGTFHDDHATRGRMEFDNGDYYSGELRLDVPHGTGFYKYKNGDTYRGLFAEGAYSGTGTFTYANGDTWRGTWKAGKRDGSGTFTRKGGKSESEFYNAGVKYVRREEVTVTVTTPKEDEARAAPRDNRSSMDIFMEQLREDLRRKGYTGSSRSASCYSSYTTCGMECCGQGYVCCEWDNGVSHACRNSCSGWGWSSKIGGTR